MVGLFGERLLRHALSPGTLHLAAWGRLGSSSCSACYFPARALGPLHRALFAGKAGTCSVGYSDPLRFSDRLYKRTDTGVSPSPVM